MEDIKNTGTKRKISTDDDVEDKSTLLKKIKTFNEKWMELPLFKHWLQPHQQDNTKAQCLACNSSLNATLGELSKHAQTVKHEKAMIPFIRARKSTLIIGPDSDVDDPDTDGENGGHVGDTDEEDDLDGLQDLEDEDDDFTGRLNRLDDEFECKRNYIFNDKCTAFVSKQAPFWKSLAILHGEVVELKLSDFKGRYLVMFFYPQDFSKLCPNEISAISDRVSEFRALNTDVVACSVDSYLTHQAWSRISRADGGIAHPQIAILSDATHTISEAYGCFVPNLGHTVRAHYIIDGKGVLRHITMNDLPVARSVDELLRLIIAFQRSDEGSIIPIDWMPGDPTLT